jgi:hypothetical protein
MRFAFYGFHLLVSGLGLVSTINRKLSIFPQNFLVLYPSFSALIFSITRPFQLLRQLGFYFRLRALLQPELLPLFSQPFFAGFFLLFLVFLLLPPFFGFLATFEALVEESMAERSILPKTCGPSMDFFQLLQASVSAVQALPTEREATSISGSFTSVRGSGAGARGWVASSLLQTTGAVSRRCAPLPFFAGLLFLFLFPKIDSLPRLFLLRFSGGTFRQVDLNSL